jgi:hypothetical protein
MVLFRIVSVAVALVPVVLFLRPAFSDYFLSRGPEITEKGISLAMTVTGEDAKYHYLSGLLTYSVHDRANSGKAVKSYLLSLERNPTDSQTWLAIARAYRDNGMPEQSGYALRKAVSLDRNNSTTTWESGVFFLLEGSSGEAIRSFRRYISMVPEEQENVYALCYSMGVEPAYLLENLIPAEYSFYKRYLSFLASNTLVAEARQTWSRMKNLGLRREDSLKYIDFLIAGGEMGEAWQEWQEFVKRFVVMGKPSPEGELLWNGHFDLPPENGGFDWRMGTAEGVRIFRDKDVTWQGDTSLSVGFDGQSNPGVAIAREIVPVEPGKRYQLSGHIKTDKLTTQNGIVLGVSGFLCDPFAVKTEPVTGTAMWKKMELEFTAPPTCKAVSVSIAREKSGKLDSKISGDAWIDSLSMTEAAKR